MGSRRHAVASLILLVLFSHFRVGVLAAADGAGGALWLRHAQARLLSMPFDIAVDRKGVVFLLESGVRVISIFSPRGEFLREIHGKGAWLDPSAVAVGPTGTIFLADGDAGRVLEMDLSGKVRREYRVGGNARLTGVAVFGDSVFCVDNRNHRVAVFRKPGAPPEFWGKRGEAPGQFQSPFRIVADPTGRIFVTDVLNARVQWFSAFGRPLGELKRFGAAEGKIFRPTGITLDPRGRIWIGDSYTGLVQLFEEGGRFVKALRAGGRPMVFGDPIGLAAAPGGVWVSDQRENRIALIRE
jgi:tripartite motif-containing protein 2/3